MPTYNPQITISAAPGITSHLRLALYEATEPNAEVAASDQFAPPHFASRQIQFIGLNPVIHLAKLFATDGVSPTGTVIANFSIDPRYPGIELKAPMFIYAGTTPGFDVGTNEFTDPTDELDGWEYDVDIRGMGRLNPDLELDKTPPGYSVMIDDYQLQDNELHIISFQPKIIVYDRDVLVPSLFSAVEILTSDTALLSGDTGKQFFIQSATSTIVITLPEIDSVPPNRLFWFTSNGGNHKNAVIEVDGSDSEKIDWLAEELTEIILGQSEHVWLMKWVDPDDVTNRRWKVLQASDGMGKVGELVYFNKSQSLNVMHCAGQLVDRDVYPRLWAFVQSLDSTQVVSDATWNTGDTNKGRFSTGNGSTTFRLPLLYNAGFLRAVDGTFRRPGSLQQHETEGLFTMFDPNSSQDFFMKRTLSAGWQADWFAFDSDGDTSGASTSNRLTGLAIGRLGTGETRPANIGAYLLIRI